MPRLFEDQFDLGDLSFNTGVRDVDGVRWYCDGLTGWEDSVEPRVQVEVFGYSDGVSAADRFPMNARYVEMEGVIRCTTREQAIRAYRKLQGVLHPDSKLDAIRRGPFEERLIDVRRVGPIEKIIDHGHTFRFRTTLMAPWPYKISTFERTSFSTIFTGEDYYRTYPRTYPRTYTLLLEESESGNTPTTSVIVNEGNAYAYPHITVTGPLLAGEWYIINDATGETLSFVLDIDTGSVLRIETREQRASLNHVAIEYYIRGDWLKMPPNTVSKFRLVSSKNIAGVTMTISAYDTWM